MKVAKIVSLSVWRVTLILLVAAFLWACSGGGGDGTEDFQPDFYDDPGPGAEELSGRVNYPDGYLPPQIFIDKPIDGTVVTNDTSAVTVSGHVAAGQNRVVALVINNAVFDIAPDGTFNHDILLAHDNNDFECITASAVDSEGYAGRQRIALLRGDSIPTDEFSQAGIGLGIDQNLLGLLNSFNPMIDELLEEMSAQGNLLKQPLGPLLIDVTHPFKAGFELSIKGITILEDYDVGVNSIELLETGDVLPDSLSLSVDLSLQGVVLELDLDFLNLFDLEFPENLEPLGMNIQINRIAVDMTMRVADSSMIQVEVESLDIDINEMELILRLPTFDHIKLAWDNSGPMQEIFSADDFAFISKESSISIPISGFLAKLVSQSLNGLVNNYGGLGLILHVSPVALDMGMLDEVLPQSIEQILQADFSEMILGIETEQVFQTPDRFGFSLGLAAILKHGVRSAVICLPPQIFLDEALTSSEERQSNFALAISGDCINRMLCAFADAGFKLVLPLGELMPDLGLPVGILAEVCLQSPPYVSFQNDFMRVAMPNCLVNLYMDSADPDGLELSMALDLIIEVGLDVTLQQGDPYLNLGLDLIEFDVCYLVDRMCIDRVLDVEQAIQGILPQIMDHMHPLLAENPLRFSIQDINDLIESATGNGLPAGLMDSLPHLTITLPEIRAGGGYISLFVNIESSCL